MVLRTLIFLVSIGAASLSLAESRVALVIGNATYAKTGRLNNPQNDAEDVAKALSAIGFDVENVATTQDLNRKAMLAALRSFQAKAAAADVAILYFTGHGIQVNNQNYLLPVDASLDYADDIDAEAISLTRAREAVSGAHRLRIVILDACRDNPFARTVKVGAKGAIRPGHGDVPKTDSFEVIVFSAEEGALARDGTGRNSPFAQAVVEALKDPARDVRLLFGGVRAAVARSTGTGGDPPQRPEVYAQGLEGDVVPIALDARMAGTLAPTSDDARVWQDFLTAKSLNSLAAWDQFLQTHRQSPLYGAAAEEARAALIRGGEVKMPAGHESDVSPPAAPKELAGLAPQRVVLQEERSPSGDKPVVTPGRVVWQTIRDPQADGEPSLTALRGQVEIPGRKIQLNLTMKRNDDAAMPASHLVELRFVLPVDFDGKGVAKVPGLIVKPTEAAIGQPLTAAVARASPGNFLLALSASEADKERNLTLLRDGGWLSIPVIYENGRRALVLIEKGPAGNAAFSQAMAAWR